MGACGRSVKDVLGTTRQEEEPSGERGRRLSGPIARTGSQRRPEVARDEHEQRLAARSHGDPRLAIALEGLGSSPSTAGVESILEEGRARREESLHAPAPVDPERRRTGRALDGSALRVEEKVDPPVKRLVRTSPIGSRLQATKASPRGLATRLYPSTLAAPSSAGPGRGRSNPGPDCSGWTRGSTSPSPRDLNAGPPAARGRRRGRPSRRPRRGLRGRGPRSGHGRGPFPAPVERTLRRPARPRCRGSGGRPPSPRPQHRGPPRDRRAGYR